MAKESQKKVFQTGTGIFGEGTPKICVPIVENSREDIWRRAEEIERLPVDIVEWRADFYRDAFRTEEFVETLKGIKIRLSKKPLLFTFRTAREGGNRSVDPDDYYRLNQAAASEGADLVDVETFLDEERTAEETEKLHASNAGCHVLASNHDFEKTPSVEEMVRRLKRMEELGADVANLAVMPVCPQDVLNLLQATVTANELLAVPVVTMSMGNMGVLSRICGSLTGSAMTFAAVGKASAPGQISAEHMTKILKIIV